MDIKYDTIKKLFESKKYIATDEIIWDTIKSIKKIIKGKQEGQDIYSIVLEGSPGAGKTFYAKTYTKILEEVFGEKVEFLEYQCDPTTGKAELYEEINVPEAIRGNADAVIIAGMLMEAIEMVNSGKKVILLLDEFEKSRRETDTFLYQLLQEGKIKGTQKGVVEIKPEYRKNLQVILCKNDERELSDPLWRRNRRITLDVMTPKNFNETVKMNLPQCDEDMRNIVTLLYEKMYKDKSNFAKFPSCSEGMLAIQDACDLLEEGAPSEVIFADILSNLLKHPDDVETFVAMFNKDKQLKEFVTKLQKDKTDESEYSAKDDIYKSFFSEQIQQLTGMEKKYQTNEKAYKKKIDDLNKKIDNLRKSMDKNNPGKKENTTHNKNSNNNNKQAYQIDVAAPVVNLDLQEDLENDFLIGDTIYMPANIINNDGSIFDGSDEWTQIMELEVDEEGWKSIQELVEGGYKKYKDENLSNYGNGPLLDGKLRTLKENEDKISKVFFKNIICYDGIILDKFKQGNGYNKIVARKEKRDGKNFYRIYSNRKIQCPTQYFLYNREADLLGFRKMYLDESDCVSYIGVKGLVEILLRKYNITEFKKRFLAFSNGMINSPKEYKKNMDECATPHGYKRIKDELKRFEDTCIKTNMLALYVVNSTVENVSKIIANGTSLGDIVYELHPKERREYYRNEDLFAEFYENLIFRQNEKVENNQESIEDKVTGTDER